MLGGISGEMVGVWLRGSIWKVVAIGLAVTCIPAAIYYYSMSGILSHKLSKCQEENIKLSRIILLLEEDLETANLSAKTLLEQCDALKKYYEGLPSRPGGPIDPDRIDRMFNIPRPTK